MTERNDASPLAGGTSRSPALDSPVIVHALSADADTPSPENAAVSFGVHRRHGSHGGPAESKKLPAATDTADDAALHVRGEPPRDEPVDVLGMRIHTKVAQSCNFFPESEAPMKSDQVTLGRGLLKTAMLGGLLAIVAFFTVLHTFRMQPVPMTLMEPTRESVAEVMSRRGVLHNTLACPCSSTISTLESFGTNVQVNWRLCDRDYLHDPAAGLHAWEAWCRIEANARKDRLCEGVVTPAGGHAADWIGLNYAKYLARKVAIKRLDRTCVYFQHIFANTRRQLLESSVFSAKLLLPDQLLEYVHAKAQTSVARYVGSVRELHAFIRFWEYTSRPLTARGYQPMPLLIASDFAGNPPDDGSEWSGYKRSKSGVDIRSQYFEALGVYQYPGTYLTTEYPATAANIRVKNYEFKAGRPHIQDTWTLLRNKAWSGGNCEADYDELSGQGGKYCSAFDAHLNNADAPDLPGMLTNGSFAVAALLDVESNGLLQSGLNVTVNYQHYFDHCTPLMCMYTEETHVDYLTGISMVVGIVGGAVSILSFFISTTIDWLPKPAAAINFRYSGLRTAEG